MGAEEIHEQIRGILNWLGHDGRLISHTLKGVSVHDSTPNDDMPPNVMILEMRVFVMPGEMANEAQAPKQ